MNTLAFCKNVHTLISRVLRGFYIEKQEKGDTVTLIRLHNSRKFVEKRKAMNFLDRALNKIGYVRSVSVEQKGSAKEAASTIIPSVRVNNDTALKFTAVFSAIRLRSENIASLPKRVFKETSNGKVADLKHPASIVTRERPNGYMNVFTFWEYLNACLDGWGNAYALIETDGRGYPIALHPLHPRDVSVTFKDREKYFKVSATGFSGTYVDGEICHFFSLSNDGISGINPISYNADAIGLGISATQFGKDFFERGGNIKAVMESDKAVDQEVFERLKTQVRSNHGTPILEDGIKYKTVGIAPEAAQMLQTKLFSIQDISRIFNIPPHMLADLSHANYSTVEQQNILFGQYSMRPTVKLYEVELERKLFLDTEDYSVKFDLKGLMRGDSQARANYYNMMLSTGSMSRNEVRVEEGLERVEGLDEFLVALNMGKNDGKTKQ